MGTEQRLTLDIADKCWILEFGRAKDGLQWASRDYKHQLRRATYAVPLRQECARSVQKLLLLDRSDRLCQLMLV